LNIGGPRALNPERQGDPTNLIRGSGDSGCPEIVAAWFTSVSNATANLFHS
jgi:hypothetical protein